VKTYFLLDPIYVSEYTETNFAERQMSSLAGEILFRVKGDIHDDIQVVQRGNIRSLRFGSLGGWQGAYHVQKPDKLVFGYQRAFAAYVSSQDKINRFLSFGVGTGTALRIVKALHPHCKLFGVEIEEAVVHTAINYFASPSYSVATYWIGDGIQLLRNLEAQFDLILVDAYMKNNIYSPVLDPAFAPLINSHLSSQGTVIFNLISKLPFQDTLLAFINAAERFFPYQYLLPVGIPFTEQNMLLIFSHNRDIEHRWNKVVKHSSSLKYWERFTHSLRFRSLSTQSACAIMP